MSPVRRRWSESGGFVGAMVGHPMVMAEARRDNVPIHPQLRTHGNLTVVTYRRPRVYLDRDAREMLPNDGVLVMHARPTSDEALVIALTPGELEDVFGEVRATESWEVGRLPLPQGPAGGRPVSSLPRSGTRFWLTSLG